ncbi:MAG: hypothetical protein AB8F94_13325 [Saprospiraceae bacterium]
MSLLLFVFLFSLASSCEEENVNVLLQDMAEFDKAYIPVLYYVRQGEMANAKKSVFFLNHSWQKINRKYKNLNPENDDWQEAFRMTDAWLSDAYFSIDAMQPRDAYIFLDHVRYQMLELRIQNGIDYYLDDVWEFEASLDLVEEVAVDQMLCLLDYSEFEEIVKDLNEQWNIVKKAKVDGELFDLDADGLIALKNQKKKMQEAIIVFNQAVEEMEGENLAMTATFLRQAYLEYLAGFGDFISSKHYYAGL